MGVCVANTQNELISCLMRSQPRQSAYNCAHTHT